MGNSQAIGEGDLRALLRIAGETAELPRDQTIRRSHIVENLCKLLGAPAGLVFELAPNPKGGFAADGTFQSVGLSEAQRAIIEPYCEHGKPPDPTVPNVVTLPGEHVTVCRHHFVSDGDWYRSEHFEAIREPADLDHQLYSRVKLAGGRMLGVGIQRALGEKPFTLKECMLLDLFHEEASRLYVCEEPPRLATDFPAAAAVEVDVRIGKLPPRLRPVLKHFVAGDSEKQVAAKLGLSKHTVHEYAKMLYRQLGVSSRGELLARFVGKAIC